MKPAPFLYLAPRSLEEALSQLGEYGLEAKLLAGGQSLVPAMNFRLAQPQVLIDLNGVQELFFIEAEGEGGLRVGAMTRQAQAEKSSLVAARAPLLAECLPWVAHPPIRNRGTIGGSLAHADPAAELPAVALALEGELRLSSHRGQRRLPAQEFFSGLFATALEPDEIVTEIHFPAQEPGTGWAFEEVARRHGDYALVGVAALLTRGEDGLCRKARLAFLSVGGGPVRAVRAEAFLQGRRPGEKDFREASRLAAEKEIDPPSDIHASSRYRRHLAAVLARRALLRAWHRTARSKA